MTQFIVLSIADLERLCDDKPVTLTIDNVKYTLCSDECYENEKEAYIEKLKKWRKEHKKNGT